MGLQPAAPDEAAVQRARPQKQQQGDAHLSSHWLLDPGRSAVLSVCLDACASARVFVCMLSDPLVWDGGNDGESGFFYFLFLSCRAVKQHEVYYHFG